MSENKRARVVRGYVSTDWQCTNPKCEELNIHNETFTGMSDCDKCGKTHYVTDRHDGSVRFEEIF